MSGGSYNYIYSTLLSECGGRMYDTEMDDLIKDLCEVLHALEWWQSGDCSESRYRNTLTKFKSKWFKGNRQERLKGYIDEQIGIVRSQLYSLIGEPQESEDKEQIEVGTKVRTIKDKDFAGEGVFPVGTIGIVEKICGDEKLPYIIRANHDYWYYSRDMFEVIEDIEPQESEE